MDPAVMNAAVVLRPWALGHKLVVMLRAAGAPWEPTNTMAAAGRVKYDAAPIHWLLDNGCPAGRRTTLKLLGTAERLDLAHKSLQNGGVLHPSHEAQVCQIFTLVSDLHGCLLICNQHAYS